jgi:hypothetical protein
MDGLIQKNRRIYKKMMSFGFLREEEKNKGLLEINIVLHGCLSMV